MASKRLKRLGFSPIVLERLVKNRYLSCKDILSRSPLELVKTLGLSYQCVQGIIRRCSKAAAPKPVTVLELQYKHQREHPAYLSTSLPVLDKVLHGGLPTGSISEITGPSGCGKTQFCIMLSVLATLPRHLGGLDGAVVYIDTESAFSAERLVEVAQNRYEEHFSTEESLVSLADNVHVYLESTCASLLRRLEKLEEDLIRRNVRLIIIDSMASLIRKEFDGRTSRNLAERNNLLTKEAALLKYLAEEFTIPVIATNQITTRFGPDRPTKDENDLQMDMSEDEEVSLEGEGGYVTAALGNTWSHSVNTRLILQYLDGGKRQVLVAKSPIAPFSNFVYTIQASGIVLEDGGASHYDGTDPGLQRIRVRSAIKQKAFMY